MSTCVRHAKELLGIDLGACTSWLRCIEVHYQRPPTSLSPDDTESIEVRNTFWLLRVAACAFGSPAHQGERSWEHTATHARQQRTMNSFPVSGMCMVALQRVGCGIQAVFLT